MLIMNRMEMYVRGKGWFIICFRMMKDDGFRLCADSFNLSQDEIAVQRLVRIGKPRGDVYDNHLRSFLLKMDMDDRFSFNKTRSSLVMRKSCRTAFVRIMNKIKV